MDSQLSNTSQSITTINFSVRNDFRKRDLTTPRVLILQGPVGPFFKKLQTKLNEEGCDAWRICFNAADFFFSNKKKRITYKQDPNKFPEWFESLLRNGQFDIVIYLGSERSLHLAAREVANRVGVRTLSLEEGYFRPGFITMEEGGNNRASPLAGLLPPPNYALKPRQQPSDSLNAFRKMVLYGWAYFVIRGVFTPLQGRKTFHKARPLPSEAFYWLRNLKRWMTNSSRNYRLVESLLEKKDKQYFLLPLQVPDDTQLTTAGRGWDNDTYLDHVIASFSRYAPEDMDLVVKVHPLSRGHSADRSMVAAKSALYGAEGRIHAIDSGSLGLICRHAAGLITINSTSGLSAIAHGTPLFLIGEAIYRNKSLATCATDIRELDKFWTNGKVAPRQLREAYLSWLSEKCVVPGDFYAKLGMITAVENITVKVKQMHQEIISSKKPIALHPYVAAE